jgi:hypothetical protein
MYRECPHCKEPMRRDASICPHCRERSPAWTFRDGAWWFESDSGWEVLDESQNQWVTTDGLFEEQPKERYLGIFFWFWACVTVGSVYLAVTVLPGQETPVVLRGHRFSVLWGFGATIAMGLLTWCLFVGLVDRLMADDRTPQERKDDKEQIAFVCFCFVATVLLAVGTFLKASDKKQILIFGAIIVFSGWYTQYLYRGGRYRWIIF